MCVCILESIAVMKYMERVLVYINNAFATPEDQ